MFYNHVFLTDLEYLQNEHVFILGCLASLVSLPKHHNHPKETRFPGQNTEGIGQSHKNLDLDLNIVGLLFTTIDSDLNIS